MSRRKVLSQRNKASDPNFWTWLNLRSLVFEHPVDEECISSLVSLESVDDEAWKRKGHYWRFMVKMVELPKLEMEFKVCSKCVRILDINEIHIYVSWVQSPPRPPISGDLPTVKPLSQGRRETQRSTQSLRIS